MRGYSAGCRKVEHKQPLAVRHCILSFGRSSRAFVLAMGAVISCLQFASDNLADVSVKAQDSRSRIEDTDYSQATTELAKRNIIQQAAQAMLAQANQAPQLVLQLLK